MKDLSNPPKFERAPTTKAKPGKVDRTGGDFGAGFIPSVSLITQGEALGHRAWIDATFNQQVADALNATKEIGIKSRFAHPSLSGDGTGTLLGRIKNARVEGERVIGDLHLAKAAHDAPDGDLAGYVMSLAEEDSKAFGLSIVFSHDYEGEDAFLEENSEEFEYTDRWGDKQKGRRFKSPDEKNTNNHYHVRLRQLHASDVVDDPAANPEGLFYRGQDLPVEADKVLAFALGLSEEAPPSLFGIAPDRVKGFLSRSLAAHGLEIRKKEEPMNTNPTPEVEKTDPPKPEVTKEGLLSEMAAYTDAFGAEKGLAWFKEGKSMADCWKETAIATREELAAAKTDIAELKTKLTSLRGEPDPLKKTPVALTEKPKSITRIVGSSAS